MACWAVVDKKTRFDPLRVIASLVSGSCESINLWAVWIYILFARSIIVYNRLIALTLPSSDRLVDNMADLFSLQKASRDLHQRMCWILTINCCSTVIFMFTSFFYLSVNHFTTLPISLWDLFSPMEMFLRLALICHTADRLTDCVRPDLLQFGYCYSNEFIKLYAGT